MAFSDLPINAALIAVFGGGVAGYGFASSFDARDMQKWPCVTGTVSTSRVEEYYDPSGDDGNRTKYRPNISYDFLVGDREYRGYRVDAAPKGAGWRSHAESMVERYPVGKQVTVHYDPANPRECILEAATAPAWAAGITVVGVLIVLGALGWIALAMSGLVDA